MKRGAWISILCSALSVGACQSPPPQADDSPYLHIPAGARLILNRPIELGPRRISFYLQHGEILDPPRAPMKYLPFCEVELNAFHDQGISLPAGEYRIERVEQISSEILASRRVMLASAGFTPSLAMDGGNAGQIGPVLYARRFHLRSDSVAEPRTVTCGHLEHPWNGTHLSLNQLREAWGGIFSLSF